MTQQKSAQINLSQALMQVSLKAIAAIGSATGLPWLAGLTALPDALAASEVLRSALGKHEFLRVSLPVPAFWTQSADAWQYVCSSIEQQLPTILDRVATALKGVSFPTDAVVQDLLLQFIAQSLPTWEVPAQERGLVAVYLARQLFTKAANELAPVLAPLRSDALLDMTANVLQLLQQAQATISPHGDTGTAASGGRVVVIRKTTIRILEVVKEQKRCESSKKCVFLRGNPSLLLLLLVLRNQNASFWSAPTLKSTAKLCWPLLFGLIVVFRMTTTRPPGLSSMVTL